MKSKEYLEGILGRPVFGFAYPRGGHSTTAQRIVKECGYLFARTTIQGNVGFPPSNPYLWGISIMAVEMSTRFLKQLISRTVLNQAGRLYVRNLAWDWKRLTMKLFEKVQVANGVLHIFGHAWELDKYPRLKDQFMEICRRISLQNDVWYTTNSTLFLNEMLRRNVHILHDPDSDARSIFRVRAKRPVGISPEEYPIPLRVTVPKNWREDFVIEVISPSGEARIGKLPACTWIDIYADEATITVSRA
jgi:hypothetical protein